MIRPDETHGRYVVAGKRSYRGHPPGSMFEAKLNRAAEYRAVTRGDIALVERIVPAIQPGSFTLPQGWLTTQHRR